MKKLIKVLSFLVLTGFLFNSCKNPTDDIELVFDASVINYKTAIMVVSSTGETLPPLEVTLTGADKDNIYDFSGVKLPFAPSGVVTLGVHYDHEPTATRSVNFNVVLKATGYLDANIAVNIVNGQMTQLKRVVLQKIGASTPVSTYVSSTAALTANATTAVFNMNTASNTNVSTITSLSIPVGTQFKGADGAILEGPSLLSQVFNYKTSDPSTLSMFPGGALNASSVLLPAAATAGPAFFLPAAFASIKMYVGNKEVKQFTKDIGVTIQLDPDYKTFNGSTLVAGSSIPLYSYDVAKGQFKFEQLGKVTAVGGKLNLSFNTNHLTVYVVGEVEPTVECKDVYVNVSAPWMLDGTRPVKMNVSSTDDVLLKSIDVVVSNGFQAVLKGLPDNIALKYAILDGTNAAVLASGDLNSPCDGPTINVALTAPPVELENITLKLNVKCPGKGTILIPNFDLYYKVAGSPASSYNILGTAEDGLIKTTLLKKGQAYDFKAIWGNSVRQVLNRTITEQDNSTTVGDGALSADDNSLLIEACK